MTSLRSTGSFYEPGTSSGNADYRIARLEYRDEDGWKLDDDEYVKTQERIPFSRVQAVTSVLPNTRNEKSFKFDENEARDDHGRWTSDGGGDTTTPTEARPEFEHSHAAPVAG